MLSSILKTQISTEGKPHLGAALGTEAFVHEFVSKKVQQWVEEVLHLSSIASTQPHAAFSAFTWGSPVNGLTSQEQFPIQIPIICLHCPVVLVVLGWLILWGFPTLNIWPQSKSLNLSLTWSCSRMQSTRMKHKKPNYWLSLTFGELSGKFKQMRHLR